jgi:hypothetical protein
VCSNNGASPWPSAGALGLRAPLAVFSVIKFKPEEGSWMMGEPDEVILSAEML